MTPRTLLGAIARDEHAYLDEWLEHHLQLGFDRIVVYDNLSEPPLEPRLDGGLADGRVEVRRWAGQMGAAPQAGAYQDCLARDGDTADWVAFLDIDEFLNLKLDPGVASFLSRFPAHDGVAVNWRMYGSAGAQQSDGRPVTERFTCAAKRDFWPNTHVKTLFRPRAAARAGVHGPEFCAGSSLVNARGERLELGAHLNRAQIAHEVAQVNHYFTKSRDKFAAKRARGRADVADGDPGKHREAAEFDAHDRNEEEDRSILRLRSRAAD